MIEAIFFDLDGVLVDAVDLHQDAFILALDRFDIKMSKEEHMKFYNGLPTKKKINKLVQLGRVKAGDTDGIYKLKQEITTDLIHRTIKPIGGVIDVVRWAHGFYDICVVSNAIRSSCKSLLEAARLSEFFSDTRIISNEDVSYPKPAPDPYQEALHRVGYHQNFCLAIEDSPVGCLSARSAGMINLYIVRNPYGLDIIGLKNYIRCVS